MNVAIIFIGTSKYFSFFPEYYRTLSSLFLPSTEKHFYVFTDNLEEVSLPNVTVIHIPHENWPFVTLNRFKYINQAQHMLLNHDYLIYIDADMKAIDCVTEEQFESDIGGKTLFAVQHPGFYNTMGTYEKNPDSLACIKDGDDVSYYVQGCFWGGRAQEALLMSTELQRRVDLDLQNGVIAVWHDESHLNKFFSENREKTAALDPGYAFSDTLSELPFRKKMQHLTKDNSALHF